METVDCLIIGAGVVGLAVARALAQAGRDVIVVDQEAGIGMGTSSRNSEVIHAGLYYAPGSLKAQLCVRGKDMLYAYAAERAIPHRRCGKLIVAASAGQRAELERIRANALACGVTDLVLMDAGQAQQLEPALRCSAALYSPSSGILDSHAFMLSLQGDAEHANAMFAFRSAVTRGRAGPRGIGLTVRGDTELELVARTVVNCAGLYAPQVARAIAGLPGAFIPRERYAKGNYFSLSGAAPFRHLVYPVPEPGGLGVHLTLDLGGQAKFGPDVEWVEQIDFHVDPRRADGFAAAIRKYWPQLPDAALQPAYAGIRPKIVANGSAAVDFLVSTPAEHGVPGLYNLFGIESPGLTAALAIGALLARNIQHEQHQDNRQSIKQALDASGQMNPGKVLPAQRN
jgi:L-2-hydroxyglutarate oxidase LhgO